MKTNLVLISLLFLGFVKLSLSQSITKRYNHLGKLYVAKFASAPFPHLVGINGHRYQGKIYSAKEHYNDSSVLFLLPNICIGLRILKVALLTFIQMAQHKKAKIL